MSRAARGRVVGEASLRKVAGVRGLGQRNHRTARRDHIAGSYLSHAHGMEATTGMSMYSWLHDSQQLLDLFPFSTLPSRSVLPAAPVPIPPCPCLPLFPQLLPSKAFDLLYTLPPHLLSYEPNFFTFPPMVN